MGLVKKMEAGDKIQSPTLTYENVGTYNADVISTAFTEGLEQYANSLGLQGQDKLDFLNAGAQMAKAIKDGNVSKKANGQFSINGSYGLNNSYTEEQIQQKKDANEVGWGAQNYEGQFQKSHGIFTSQETKEFRRRNNILGMVGSYLNSVLNTHNTIEAAKKESEGSSTRGIYNFDRAFEDINLGGNGKLLQTWKDTNTTNEARLQGILGALEKIDINKWAEASGKSTEELNTLKELIKTNLEEGKFEEAKNNALKAGIDLGNYLVSKPVATSEEVLEQKFREAVIKQRGLEYADDATIDQAVEDAKQANAQKYQKILDDAYDRHVEEEWVNYLNKYTPGVDEHELAYNIVENYIIDPATDLEKLIKGTHDANAELRTTSDTKLRNLYRDLINASEKTQKLSRQLELLQNAQTEDELSGYQHTQADLDMYTHKFAESYDLIKKLLNSGIVDSKKVTLANFFKDIEIGPYKGWKIVLPAQVEGSKYSMIINVDPSSPYYKKVRRVKSNYVSKEAFKNEYEQDPQHKRPQAKTVLRKQGGVLSLQLGGWVSPGADDDVFTTKVKVAAPNTKAETPTENKKETEESEYVSNSGKVSDMFNSEAEMSGQDIARLVGLAGDLVSLFGGVAGGIGGIASIGGDTTANIWDAVEGKKSAWEATKDTGINVGLSILGLIPGFGLAKFAKGSKYASTASKLIAKAIAYGTTIGVISNYEEYGGIIKKLKDGNFKDLTWDEVKQIANLASLVSHGVKKHPRQRRTRENYTSGQYKLDGTATIRTADGSPYKLSVEDLDKLSTAKVEDRASVFADIQKSAPGFKEGDVLKELPETRIPLKHDRVIDVTHTDFKVNAGTSTDVNGVIRKVRPGWADQLYWQNSARLNMPRFDWAQKVAKKARSFNEKFTLGDVVKLPEGTVETNGIFKTPAGQTFRKQGDIYVPTEAPTTPNVAVPVTKPVETPKAAETSSPKPAEPAKPVNTNVKGKSGKKRKKHKQGGTVDFIDSVITKYAGGGRAGITQNTSWLNAGGREAIKEAMARLDKGSQSYIGDQYWKTLNDAQTQHSKLYNASNFAKTQGRTYYEGQDVTDYQTKYNEGLWNDISIWPKYQQSYTVLSPNSEKGDMPGTNGIDGRYAGITDFRRILGRKGDWDGYESELAEVIKGFKNLGYDYYLDEPSGYYMLKPTEAAPSAQSSAESDASKSGSSGSTSTQQSENNENLTPSETDDKGGAGSGEVKLNGTLNWGNISEAMRTAFLNAQNTRATKQAMNYRIPQKGYIHRMELLEGNYPAKQAAAYQSAGLKSIAAQPLTSDADKNIATMLAATEKGNLMNMEAAFKDADRFYETRHKIQNIQNEDMLENLNRRDYNNAAIAEKTRIDAGLKAHNTLENARNLSNLWAGYNQQFFENMARRQQLYNTYIQRQAANKLDAHYREYIEALSKPGANPEALKKNYIENTQKIYDNEYNNSLGLLSSNPFRIYYPSSIIKSAKGSKLTASERYILESNKDFNKALRENRKEFHKDIRETNKRRRRN